MKAAVYYETGGPEVFRYEDVPDPQVRPGGIVFEVKAIGIQGGDTLHRQGGVMATTPHIVGYQAAGVVREAGERVTEFKPGDPVVATMGFGSHAELCSVPEGAAWKVPDGLSLEEAAGVPVEFATADDCLFEFGHLKAGESVLIQAGASGVGLAAIQLAKRAGATVLATASQDEKLERLKEYGLDHGINYRMGDFVAKTMEATSGRGVDLVVDSVGARRWRAASRHSHTAGGSRVGRAGRDEVVPEIWPLMQKNASITGVFLGAEMQVNPQRTRPLVQRLLERCATGELKVVIDRTFPLSQAADAHRYVESRQAFGRVIMAP
jgi:NADPH2:quinone reductase